MEISLAHSLSACFTDLRERLTDLLFCSHRNDHVEPEEWKTATTTKTDFIEILGTFGGIGLPTSRMCCQAKVIVIGLRVETTSILRC